MEEEEVLDLESRRMVYQFIRSHPGLHLRVMEKRLPLSLGALRYHLDYLERRNLITSRDDGYRKTYFSSRDVYLLDRDLLALLRQRVPRRMILHLMASTEATFEELRQAIGGLKVHPLLSSEEAHRQECRFGPAARGEEHLPDRGQKAHRGTIDHVSE